MNILSIDQGTTGTSALLLQGAGAFQQILAVEHDQHYPQKGWVEHDPEALIRSLQSCIAAAGPVDALGIDNQGESCLAWNGETKEAISPVIVWQDTRTQARLEDLRAEGVADFVQAKTGLPLDAYFSASKLGWLFEKLPEARRLHRAGKLRLGTTDAFFLDRLTGRCVTDITTASRTSLMDLESGQWDPELCRLFGVPLAALPEILPTTGDFGGLLHEGRPIAVTASLVDQQAALYGHGCRRAGDAKITFGTGAFALALTGEEIFRAPDKGLLPTVAWQRGDAAPVYALDGGVYSAASAINWVRRLGLFENYDDLNFFEGPSAIERGIVLVPAFSGLACPHWDRSATGLCIGLTLDTTKADIVRAALEGVALRAAEVLEAMGAIVALGAGISVDGGMSANPSFCQFFADVLQRDIRVPKIKELTGLGTALLAAEGANQAQTMPRIDEVVYQPKRDLSFTRAHFRGAVERSRGWTENRR